MVLAGHPRRPGLDDDGHARRPGALRRRARSRYAARSSSTSSCSRSRRRSTRIRSTPTPRRRRSVEPGRVYVDLRLAGHRGDRHQDRQGPLGAARLRVQSLPRRRLVAGHLPRPAADALRRQRHQFVVALDKRTGKTVWRTPRSIDFQDLGPDGKPKADGDFRKAFSTPQIVDGRRPPDDDQPRLEGRCTATTRRPARRCWRLVEARQPLRQHASGRRPRPGLLCRWDSTRRRSSRCVPTARATSPLHPSRGGSPKGAPSKPSILLVGDADLHGQRRRDRGLRRCQDRRQVWRGRVDGTYSASPLFAGGRIYFFNEDGKTTVLEAGREFKVLAENFLDDGFMASPAVDGKALFLRTRTHVYRIEEP